jgi:Tfp pilus assembly protein PilF
MAPTREDLKTSGSQSLLSFKFTPENFARSKKYFEQAVSVDPHYVMAWHGLAEFFFKMGVLGYMETK